MHSDCLKLFIRETRCSLQDGLRWLRVAATWRSPWQGAVPLNAPPLSNVQNVLGRLDGPSKMALLPRELTRMIWELASLSSSWYCSVLDLASQVPAQIQARGQDQQQLLPLAMVRAWRRGRRPDVHDNPEGAYIALAVDSRGLRDIQGLGEMPLPSSSRSDHVGFVVEAAERFSGVLVEFRAGLSSTIFIAAYVNCS